MDLRAVSISVHPGPHCLTYLPLLHTRYSLFATRFLSHDTPPLPAPSGIRPCAFFHDQLLLLSRIYCGKNQLEVSLYPIISPIFSFFFGSNLRLALFPVRLLPPVAYFLYPTSCLLSPTSCLLPPVFSLLSPTSCLLPPVSYLLSPTSCFLPPSTTS